MLDVEFTITMTDATIPITQDLNGPGKKFTIKLQSIMELDIITILTLMAPLLLHSFKL